ncbi:MAG: ABC transporter permease [Clostridiaceae bacterium]
MKKHNESAARTRDSILIVAASFLLALLVGALILLIQGENPIEVYRYLLIDPLISKNGLLKVLGKATPLIFTGLAATLAFRCNVFNIGLEGQLYAGALTAAVLGYTLQGLPAWLHLSICFLGAMTTGALCAFIPAWLKVKFGVHEVITTIMLNYIISNIISMLVVNYFRNPGETARTPYVLDTARLTQFQAPEQVNTGLIIGIILCIVAYWVFSRTVFGSHVDAAGKNLTAARYSGINADRLVIVTMMLSGAVAALGGLERSLGAFGYMEVNFSPGFGYDGLAICIIARMNPLGVLIVALLMGLMNYGGLNLNIMTTVPTEWVRVLTGLIFAFVVIGNTLLKRRGGVLFRKKESQKEEAA